MIRKITTIVPLKHFDISQIKYLKSLALADPTFNVPSKIDKENRNRDTGVVFR